MQDNAPSSAPLLRVKDLTVRFKQAGQETHAVKAISFHLERGQTLALVGESGSGKSVTALSILGLLDPVAARVSGQVYFKGTDLIQADTDTLRAIRGQAVTMIFQEPMTSLNPLHTIEKQIGEILLLHKNITGDAARKRILDLLQEVGLQNAEQRLQAYPHQLSGGQRQRVMIAMALANEPDLLIADEPTTALDVTVQAQILALLEQIQKARGMAMLFITHDLGIVRKFADHVAVMQAGHIVEQGPVHDVFSRPHHSYTQSLLQAEPSGEPLVPAADAPVVIQADHIKVWFPIRQGFWRKIVGHVKAVNDVSLSIRAGETVGLVGESGSGKSTLGLALLRLTEADGQILYLGERLDGLSMQGMRPYRQQMQIVFQDPFGALSPRLSVADIITEGFEVMASPPPLSERRERAARAMVDVGLDPLTMDRYPHEFSGGQRQRIAIARAIALNPKLIVLDEPTSALDMSVQAQIVTLLRDIQKRREMAFLFISHDLKVVRALAHQIIVLKGGEVVEAGLTKTLLKNPQNPYTKALFAAAFEHHTLT